MMIWFTGILENILVVSGQMKIKQTKQLSCEFGVFYSITRVDYRVISYKY